MNFEAKVESILLVMGRALGLAWAWPGVVHFWRARAQFFGKGPGSAWARCQSPGAYKGLLRRKKISIVRIKFYCKECKIQHAFSAQAKCLETKSLFM